MRMISIAILIVTRRKRLGGWCVRLTGKFNRSAVKQTAGFINSLKLPLYSGVHVLIALQRQGIVL